LPPAPKDYNVQNVLNMPNTIYMPKAAKSGDTLHWPTSSITYSVICDSELCKGCNLNTGQPSNIEAYLGQLTGIENTTLYRDCRKKARI
jgi:hypothetical protein